MHLETLDEEAIFKVACRIDADDARADYLRQVCGQDEALRSRVEELLRTYLQDPEYLEAAHPTVGADVELADMPQVIGSSIGPYTLRERIGEGGMGEVYVAEQTAGVRRKVALKIIRPGMATKDVVARFEAERQALAMMDHPHIARVFDGGATESGQPYFVMELVQGLPITEYCDAKRLDTRRRLKLFAQVCRAVHHAHQKGIIHRDLKPSNVLVPEIDGVAVPKVIDFGIAKAVSQKLTEQTLYTNFREMVGTPLYMSPEQAGMGVVDIDTRSDIYSLGVLLYELITGSTPFDREQLKSVGFDEMRRIIREDEPPKPSTRVDTLKADVQSTVSQQRASDPRTLFNLLRGELDWIVMKALDKNRSRRYESAIDLAEDVRRYLHDDPISARPASRWYRIRKFSRRNRPLVASLAAVFLALSVGAAVSSFALLTARLQRDIAVSRLDDNDALLKLLGNIFAAEWGTSQRPNQTLYDSLETIAPRLDTELMNHPSVEVKVRQFVADVYRQKGQFDSFREHLNKALARATAMHEGKPHETVAEIHATLADEIGWNFNEPLDHAKLLDHAEQAIEIYETLGIESGQYGKALFAKGQCLLAIFPIRKADAEQAQRTCAELAEREGNHPVIPWWDLGLVRLNLGEDRLDDAQRAFERAVENALVGKHSPMKIATARSGLGRCLLLKGELNQTITEYETSWHLFRTTHALRNEPRGYRVAIELVNAYFALGNLQKTFGLLDELETRLADESSPVGSRVECLILKGWNHFQLEDYEQAGRFLQEAVDLAEEQYGTGDARFGVGCGYLAMSLEASNQVGAAAEQYRRLLEFTQPYVENMSPRHDHDIIHWLHVRASLGSRPSDGSQLIDALSVAKTGIEFAHETNWLCKAAGFYELVARLQLQVEGQGRPAAIKSLEAGLENAAEPAATYRSDEWRMPLMRGPLESLLARLYLEEGKPTEAHRVLEEGVQIRDQKLPVDHIQTAMAKLRLGRFLVNHSNQFDTDHAEKPLLDAYQMLQRDADIEAVSSLRRRTATVLSELYQTKGHAREAAEWQALADAPRPDQQIEVSNGL